MSLRNKPSGPLSSFCATCRLRNEKAISPRPCSRGKTTELGETAWHTLVHGMFCLVSFWHSLLKGSSIGTAQKVRRDLTCRKTSDGNFASFPYSSEDRVAWEEIVYERICSTVKQEWSPSTSQNNPFCLCTHTICRSFCFPTCQYLMRKQRKTRATSLFFSKGNGLAEFPHQRNLQPHPDDLTVNLPDVEAKMFG